MTESNSTLTKTEETISKIPSFFLLLSAASCTWTGIFILGFNPGAWFLLACAISWLVFGWTGIPMRSQKHLNMFGLAILVVIAWHQWFGNKPSDLIDAHITSGVQWLVASVVQPALYLTVLRKDDVRKFSLAWIAGIATSGLVAISAYFGYEFLSISSNWMAIFGGTSKRQAGLTAHPNSLGLQCAMGIALLFYLKLPKQQLIAFGLPLALGLLVSGSRASQVAGGLVLAYQAISRARNNKTWILSIRLLLLGPILFVSYQLIALATDTFGGMLRFSTSQTSSSDLGHLMALERGLRLFGENPFIGNGFTEITSSLNIIIQVLSSGGIVLTLAFLGLVGSVLRLNEMVSEERRGLRLAILVWIFVGLSQNALVDPFIYVPVGLAFVLDVSHSALPILKPPNIRPN